jgi:hypothetical protein
MQLFEMLSQAGIVALLSLAVVPAPMVMGVLYAIRPSEARLALMRPLALASIFASLCSFLSGLIHILHALSVNPAPSFTGNVALGLSEALVPIFIGCGCLTVAWLCVALGLRRHPELLPGLSPEPSGPSAFGPRPSARQEPPGGPD